MPQYLAAPSTEPSATATCTSSLPDNRFLLYSVGPNGKDDGGRGVDDRTANEDCDNLSVRMPPKDG